MEVSLNHAERDQRAEELARLVLLRGSVANRQATKRAELKAEHEKVLAALDERIEKLAGAVRNGREETDAQLSMEFIVSDPGTGQAIDVDALADEIQHAEAEEKPAKKTRGKKGRKAEEAQA